MTNTDDVRRELAEITEKTAGHTEGDWHYEYGNPDMDVSPETPVTREQFLNYCARCWDLTPDRTDHMAVVYTGKPETIALIGPGPKALKNAALLTAAPYLKEIATTLAQRALKNPLNIDHSAEEQEG